MIREFQRDDINKVADIWMDTNIKAHNFIPAEYWKSNFKSVKEALLLAEVIIFLLLPACLLKLLLILQRAQMILKPWRVKQFSRQMAKMALTRLCIIRMVW